MPKVLSIRYSLLSDVNISLGLASKAYIGSSLALLPSGFSPTESDRGKRTASLFDEI